jgi:hypothetical protein
MRIKARHVFVSIFDHLLVRRAIVWPWNVIKLGEFKIFQISHRYLIYERNFYLI